MNDGEVLVSYKKISDKKGLKWLFPDEAGVQSTSNTVIKYFIDILMFLIR